MTPQKHAGIFCCLLAAGCGGPWMARPAAAEELNCTLRQIGDCCSVVIDSGHEATVRAAIDAGAQTDYVLIINGGESNCIYGYDGEIKTPMRLPANGFNGMWIGGTFTLSYQTDAKGRGACSLAVFHSATGYDAPEACVNGHFKPVRSDDTMTETTEQSGVPPKSPVP